MQPLCYTCINCALICTIYETALSRGYEADWWRVGQGYSGILYAVEVPYIGYREFDKLVQFARAIAPTVHSNQLSLALTA